MIHKILALFAFILPTMIGCVAINVGEPQTVVHEDVVPESVGVPFRTEVTDLKPSLTQTDGNQVEIGLSATLREHFEKREHSETVAVRLQNRLAIGIFPGAAEYVLMPTGALMPTSAFGIDEGRRISTPFGKAKVYGSYPTGLGCYSKGLGLGLMSACVPVILGTVDSLLFEPFEQWGCQQDLVDADYLRRRTGARGTYWDASDSPKIQALTRLTQREQEIVGIDTCFRQAGVGKFSVLHFGLAGMHKYRAVFVDPVKAGPSRTVGEEVRTRGIAVEGPFAVALSIPELNWSERQNVAFGEKKAVFDLPQARVDCTVEAEMSVLRQPDDRSLPDVASLALNRAEGKMWPVKVILQGRKGTPHEDRLPVGKPTYEIVGKRSLPDGRFEVRVSIGDKSQVFDIGRAVEQDVRVLIRREYLSRNPGVSGNDVHEAIQWETEKDSAILVYTGRSFTVLPVQDGYSYNTSTRKGQIRLRISDGVPPEEAKRWARNNISTIVSDKNVALESGKPPPPGARFRSLDENFSDGVLTVEFEAIE